MCDTIKGRKRKKDCICRGPDTGETMIGCDYCKDWFHLTCVDLSPEEAEELDLYKCPNCQLVEH